MADDPHARAEAELLAKLKGNPELEARFRWLTDEIAAGRLSEDSPECLAFFNRIRTGKEESLRVKDINDVLCLYGPDALKTSLTTRLLEPLPPEQSKPQSEPGSDSTPPRPPDRDGDIEYPPGLPNDCPVVPLGDDETMCYYLDPAGRQIGLEAGQHGRLNLLKLFGDRQDWLYQRYPRRKFIIDKRTGKGEWITNGWHCEHVAEHLMAAAHRKGFWQPSQRVRHLGARQDDDGSLVLHCGDAILHHGKQERPGLIGNYLYPAKPPLLRPWHLSVGPRDRHIDRIQETLSTWTFLGGGFDADLLLGAIGCAFVGGALRWRPMFWLTGGTGTGKSTLRSYIASILHRRLLAIDNSTEAGVREWIALATLAVAIDEAESEDDNRNLDKLVRMARSAASGSLVLRGSSQQKPIEYIVQSVYFFSSILIPPLPPQDRNRFCIVSLGPLAHDNIPVIDAEQSAEDGRHVLRRLVDHWSELPNVSEVFRRALLAEKLSARAADLYSTILAARHLLLSDGLVRDSKELALKVVAREDSATDGDVNDEWRCLQRLTATLLPLDAATFRRPAREWLARRWFRASFEHDSHDPDRVLASYGMAYVVYEADAQPQPEEPPADKAQEKPELWTKPPRWLAVAHHHPELEKIFRGTHWSARGGADGPWRQSLERLPGARRDGRTRWFPGKGNARYTLIPLAHVFDVEEIELLRRRYRPSCSEQMTSSGQGGAA